jgi:hypothetical protein
MENISVSYLPLPQKWNASLLIFNSKGKQQDLDYKMDEIKSVQFQTGKPFKDVEIYFHQNWIWQLWLERDNFDDRGLHESLLYPFNRPSNR